MVHAGRSGSVREQRALQLPGPGVLGVVESCAFQGLRDQGADGGQQGALFVGQVARLVEHDHADTEGAPGGGQRQERPGLLADVLRVVGHSGITRRVLLGRGDEQRPLSGDRVPDRVFRDSRTAVDAVEECAGVADGSDVADPVALDGLYEQPGGAERRQHPLGHRVHHVP